MGASEGCVGDYPGRTPPRSSKRMPANGPTPDACIMCAMTNIEALIADGGEITVGALWPHPCVATAADQHNALAMLVRRDGETLPALLKRLDLAIGKACGDGGVTDEVNSANT